MITRRAVAREILSLGWGGAPRLMVASIILALLGPYTLVASAVGLRVFVSGAVRGETRPIVVGAVLLSVGWTLIWALIVIDTNVVGAMTDRLQVHASTLIGRLVNRSPGLEHLERPDHRREIELLHADRNALCDGPRQSVIVLRFVLRTLAMLALFLSVDPRLAAIAVFSLGPVLADLYSARTRRQAQEASAEDRRLAAELLTMTTSAATGKELRVFDAAGDLIARHHQASGRISRRENRGLAKTGFADAAAWGLYAVAVGFGALLISHQVAAGDATAGQAVMVILLAQQGGSQSVGTARAMAQLALSAQAARRFIWLRRYVASQTQGRAIAPERLTDGISLERVAFRYPGDDREVLRGLTAHLPAGSVVALVGVNGAGKTTLTKLLCGFYQPTGGRILVDGRDLADMDMADWRSHLSAAFHDAVRYELTAGQVVGLGDLSRMDDRDAVMSAVERANATRVLAELDDGLDTPLGASLTDGRELSGGQWQSLSVGRALMRTAPLLVLLDEPTASLDSEAEYVLFEAYAASARAASAATGAVTVFVTHRYGTARIADLIMVVDQGRVAEFGTHSELIAGNGAYSRLYTAQAASYQ